MSKDVLKKNPLLVAIISSMVCSIVIISLGYLILERSYLSRKLNQDMKILEFFGKKHVAMVPPIREGIYSGDDLLLRVDESGNNILYVTGKMISMSERFIKNFDYVVFNNKILGPYDNVDGIYLTKDGRKYAYIVNSLNPKFVGKKREEVESEFFMYNPYDEAYVVVNGKQEFKYNKIQAFNWDEERGNYLYVGLSISKNENEEPKCSIVYNGRIITSTVELVDPLSTCGGSFVSLSPDGKNFYYLAEITKENKRVLFFNDKKVEDFPYILSYIHSKLVGIRFTKDNKLAYVVYDVKNEKNKSIKMFIFDGNKKEKIFQKDLEEDDEVINVYISDNGRKALYAVRNSRKESYLFLNDKKIKLEGNLKDWNRMFASFSPDSSRIAVVFSFDSISTDKVFIIDENLNSKEYGTTKNGNVEVNSMQFTEDNQLVLIKSHYDTDRNRGLKYREKQTIEVDGKKILDTKELKDIYRYDYFEMNWYKIIKGNNKNYLIIMSTEFSNNERIRAITLLELSNRAGYYSRFQEDPNTQVYDIKVSKIGKDMLKISYTAIKDGNVYVKSKYVVVD